MRHVICGNAGTRMRLTFPVMEGILKMSLGGGWMRVYLDLMILLNFTVDMLLILSVNRLCGYPLRPLRSAGAGVIGAVYAAACIMPGFRFLSEFIWRVVALCVMSVVAFGWNRSTLRRGLLLIFLSMTVGGIATSIGRGGFLGVISSASTVFLLSRIGFLNITARKRCVSVELIYGGRKRSVVALCDTGNLLIDPVSGQRVLVAGPEIAWDIAAITPSQLAQPIETVSQRKIPGLRLIPYRCVGQSCGTLLAMKFDSVKVAGVEYGQLVAFSPTGFGDGCEYQALLGGEI